MHKKLHLSQVIFYIKNRKKKFKYMVLRPGTQRTFRLLRRTSLGYLFKSCLGRITVKDIKDILVNKTNIKSLL